MRHKKKNEGLPPVANNPPGNTFAGKAIFFVRSLLDMQVSSVYRDLRPWLEERSGTLLEVGCGAQPYRYLVPDGCRYTGLDSEEAEANFAYRLPDTIYYGGGQFPFEDGSFDNLFHTEVLEHVYHAGQFLAECRRVLKPGGGMFFTVPFQARYHYIPHDFFRYTPAALERMLDEAGFTEIAIRPRGSDITVAANKCISVFYRWLRSGLPGIVAGAVISPFALATLIVGWLSLRLTFGSYDDCLGYTVTARA
ncbi:MAG TPA: methyltransferase domain-containing protein [Desulfuromonadales bacterium]|nr:methyltransferase domain-containing protein [Desulfuromonadales bacterium]